MKIFSGINQTVLNENANAIVRDKEIRQSTSKRMAEFTAWNAPVAGRLLKQYGRLEVEPINMTGGELSDEAGSLR